jgi:hypothetical protein
MAERGILEQAYGQLIPQGMRPNYAAPRTSVEPTPMVGRGEIRPYTFSWRDMAKQWLGSIGMSDNTANAVITLADFTPVGAAFVGNEARRAVTRGERLAPAVEVAMAAIPLPMAAKRAASKVAREVAQEVPSISTQGITAYHGSPHSFDRFDMSKIGTGEGAQAYGRGLYFAENEDVAQGYRDTLTKGAMNSIELKKIGLSPNDRAHAMTFARTTNNLFPEVAARDFANYSGKELTPDLIEAFRKTMDVPKGSMYQVRIDADPADFLDYDAPLSGQSEKVRAALGYDKAIQQTAQIDAEIAALRDAVRTQGRTPAEADKAAMSELMRKRSDVVGQGVQSLAPATPEQMQGLLDRGIVGVKYKDAGSRGAEGGTRNFVVFDDKLINILKKYSWVPGMAIPAAAIQEYTTMYGVAPNLGGETPSVTVY